MSRDKTPQIEKHSYLNSARPSCNFFTNSCRSASFVQTTEMYDKFKQYQKNPTNQF